VNDGGESTGVQVGAQQHRAGRRGGQFAQQGDPGPGQTRIEAVRGTGGCVTGLELIRPGRAHRRQRAERMRPGRLSPQAARIPAPTFFLLGAAATFTIVPKLASVSRPAVQDGVTVALALILFDGGMRIGWRQFRPVAAATAGLAAHFLFSFGWRPAFLPDTALAPADPAVVFSVLGQRQVSGRIGGHCTPASCRG
jgi:hypothetical protein